MKLADQAALLGMSERHGVFVRQIDGYQVQLITRRNLNMVNRMPCLAFVLNRSIEKEDRKAIMEAQGLLKGYLNIDSVGITNNTVFIIVAISNRSVKKVEDKIYKMIETFKSLGLSTLKGCPFCSDDEATNGHRIINGVTVDVHEACVKSFVEQSETEIDAEAMSKGMLKSLVYAFVGAIFGAIPAMIVLLGFNYFVGLLFIAIPFTSFYFYKYGKGPRTMLPLVIITLFSLLLVPLIIVFIYHAIAMAFDLTLFEAIASDSEFATEFYSNLVSSFVFSLIGVAVSGQYIFKHSTRAHKKKLAEYK